MPRQSGIIKESLRGTKFLPQVRMFGPQSGTDAFFDYYANDKGQEKSHKCYHSNDSHIVERSRAATRRH